MTGWLAATCGLAELGERLRPTELVERFDIARLPREATIVAEVPFG